MSVILHLGTDAAFCSFHAAQGRGLMLDPERHVTLESRQIFAVRTHGRVVKLADTPDLGSGAARLVGSNPTPPTSRGMEDR